LNTFKHSGDLGDIIYSLPTIKDLGGGILYLDISGGKSDKYVSTQLAGLSGGTKFNKNGFDFIYPLLIEQEYIKDVLVYNGEPITYNLNKFRDVFMKRNPRLERRCLVDLHREAFDLPEYDINKFWLSCGNPIRIKKPIIISRSPRLQSAHCWLESRRKLFEDKGTFIGIKKEHELFEWTFNINVDFYESGSALDIAKVISGGTALIANSTFNLALGVGLKEIKIIQETSKEVKFTNFNGKKGMEYI
jgi:hypothetical protein